MSSAALFETCADCYDSWYDRNFETYRAELKAAEKTRCDGGVEIGVGTGRFAGPLGLRAGLDPSAAMLKKAPRHLDLVQAVGEAAPFRDGAYPCALVVVTLCFADDPEALVREMARVAEKAAICIVPRDSPIGRRYRELGAEGHVFYSRAKFYTVAQVADMARRAGLTPVKYYATLPGEGEPAEPVELDTAEEAESYGFVCVAAERSF